MKCKRCNRELRSEKSIKLGYGETCYRIVNLKKPVLDIETEISFLRMEIKLLKTLIKSNNIVGYRPIERIKITKQDLGPSREKNKMSDVIKEMKALFSTDKWKDRLVSPSGQNKIIPAPSGMFI